MTFSCVWEATMLERAFLDGISRIYRSARDSDDGARCMVAPHPDLRARIKSAIAAMAATGGLVDFSDRQMVQTRQHFQDLFFSLGQPKKSVREYYRDVRHGLIKLQRTVVA